MTTKLFEKFCNIFINFRNEQTKRKFPKLNQSVPRQLLLNILDVRFVARLMDSIVFVFFFTK